MNHTKRYLKQVVLSAGLSCILFAMAACSPAQVTQVLNAAVTAAEIALSTIGTQSPGAQAALQYVTEASTVIQQVGTILAANDSGPVKAARVTEALSAFVGRSPYLPPGTPQTIVATIGALASALQNVLNTYGQPPAGPSAKLGASQPVQRVSDSDLRAAAGSFTKLADRARRNAIESNLRAFQAK